MTTESPETPTAPKTPKQILQVLVKLQTLDAGRDKNANMIATAEEVVKTREKDVERFRLKQKACEDALIQAKKAAATVELELKSKAANIQKLELQQNTAKTNQEYQALLQHIQKLRVEVSKEEDAGLVNYERITEAEKALATAKAAVVTAEAEFKSYSEVCTRDSEEARREIAATDGKRRDLLAQVPPDIAENYEKIRGARGVAVNPLDGRSCSGCGVLCTPNEVQKLVGASVLIQCKSCQRYLYSTAAIPYV